MKKAIGILSQFKIFLGILSIFCLFTIAKSYDNQITHPALSSAAVDIYNNQAHKKITSAQRSEIIKGSIHEDTAPRFINHFYDPGTGLGYHEGGIVGLPAKTWAQDQSGPYADYSEGAILFNYKNGNIDEAYKGIGHIIHLIQDMAVPAHTRNDSHADGDPYEEWAGRYGKINYSKLYFNNINNLDSVFEDLSLYTNNNFYSRKTIDKNIKFIDTKQEKDFGGYDSYYGYFKDYRIIKIIKTKGQNEYLFDDKVHLDYWNQLYPKAVGYSAGVIAYFQNKFTEIDAEKEELSLMQKIKGQIKIAYYNLFYNLSDGFFFAQNGVENFFRSTEEKYNETKDFLAYFIEANQEIAENIINEAVNTSDTVKKVLADKIKKENDNIKKIAKDAIYQLKKTANAKTDDKPTAVIGQDQGDDIGKEIVELKYEKIIDNDKNTDTSTTTKQIVFYYPLPGGSGDSEELDTSIISGPLALSSSTEASFAFASNKPDANFFINFNNFGWLPAGANISTTSEEGDNSIEVKAEKNGIYDLAPATYSWTVDTLPPIIDLILKPDLYSSSSIAEFKYEINEATATVAVSIDGNDIATSTRQFIITDLLEGSHEIRFLASDEAGNSTNSFYSWEVDTRSPTTTMNALPATVSGEFLVEWSAEDDSAINGHDLEYFIDHKINDNDWTNWLSATTATSSLLNMDLNENKTIYFRASAKDIFGNRGEWSDIISTEFKKQNSNHIVISQVQISGHTASDEFVELYNPGHEDVDISGYSLKRKTSGGTEYNLLPAFANSTIKANSFLLVSHPNFMGNIYPDEVYSSASYGLAANNTVIIYNNENEIVDKLGYGTAGDNEGSAFIANPGNYESLLRKRSSTSTADSLLYGADRHQGNGYDTDNNTGDFVLNSEPIYRNSDSPAEPANASDIYLPEIDDFEVKYTGPNDYSATFQFTSQRRQNIAPGAYYEIRYWPSDGDVDCQKNINWKTALIVPPATIPSPPTHPDEDIDFIVEPEVESASYCWFMRVYNGRYWSEVAQRAVMF